MDKLLTISIAAYNVSNYIEKTLESILATKYLDKIEVIVIDDGGTDNTYSLVKKYAERYPNVISVIQKKNGGYGSTVNLSLRLARGKFYRLLDGDDWICSDNLDRYIELLINSYESDIVVNDVIVHYEDTEEDRIQKTNWCSLGNGEYSLLDKNFKYLFSMWQLTVNTNKLRNVWVDLPEHTLYTDQLYVYYSLLSAHSIRIEHFPVYCYRVGRAGQSVERKNILKHYDEYCRVFELMLEDYTKRLNMHPSVDKRVETTYAEVINILLMFKRGRKWYHKIKEYEQMVKNSSPLLYTNLWWRYKKITCLRLFDVMAYFIFSSRTDE